MHNMKRNCRNAAIPALCILAMASVSVDVQAGPVPAYGGGTYVCSDTAGGMLGECAADAYDEATAIPEYEFHLVRHKVYALKEAVLKGAPYDDAVDAGSVKKYDEFLITGENGLKYQQVCVDGDTWYIDGKSITDDVSVIEGMKAEDVRKAREAAEAAERAEQERIAAEQAAALAQPYGYQYNPSGSAPATAYAATDYSGSWGGGVLSASAGVNYGPSGKETYYNLDMSGVVGIMRGMGNTDQYWVRADGVKMLGEYVMVAANLDVHPRGSLVETSLGTGIVADTGGFAYGNPNQLDVATSW